MNRIFKPIIVHICNYMMEPEKCEFSLNGRRKQKYSVSHELGVRGMCEPHCRVGASSQGSGLGTGPAWSFLSCDLAHMIKNVTTCNP